MAHSDKTVAEALREYQQNELTTKDIARKYGVSASTITVWATNAGVKLRSRGRRKRDQPTIRQMKIINLAQVRVYQDVGRKFGISKQAVHRVLRRWSKYAKPKRPPFEPGDIILWKGQKFRVIDAGIETGTLLDRGGSFVRCFTWNSGGVMPKKIGFDQRYALVAKAS